jgi:hypothetical protein
VPNPAKKRPKAANITPDQKSFWFLINMLQSLLCSSIPSIPAGETVFSHYPLHGGMRQHWPSAREGQGKDCQFVEDDNLSFCIAP